MEEIGGGGVGGGEEEIYRLPEECISHAIALTSPRDACRSAAVSTAFRSAVTSDDVWRNFLPPDFEAILARAVDPVDSSSLKDLFFRLSERPILIDGGKMSFTLEKSSGAKCYMLSARALSIAWGDTPEYWRWIQLPDSSFSEAAELLNVCWLEIHGKIESKLLSRKTTYVAYLIFKLVDRPRGLSRTQEASVVIGAHFSKHPIRLHHNDMPIIRIQYPFNRRGRIKIPIPREAEEVEVEARLPQTRDDGWMEMELGDFYNDEGEDGEVDISLKEVKRGHWKNGLIIQRIELRPKKLG